VSSFRARARTVDLLGRQQIAGIPTAVSELFKNAHDAYATQVEVDFYREDRLFILRDDGVGMSPEDFEQRWLTLGTESKLVDGRGIKPPPALADQARPVLGEKGIGRLAIASIGSQALVLTRQRSGRQRPTTVALINWRLFEIPGVDLNDVRVPLLHLDNGALPDEAGLARMASSIRRSLKKLNVNTSERETIEADLARLDFSPADVLGGLGRPSLTGRGHGTSFIVVPTREQLAADIDGASEQDDDVAPPLVKTLVGFANTMTPDAPEPRIRTAFRDHKKPDDVDDIIETKEFFTPDDFKSADHHIQGWFDAAGFFTGSVDVYGQGAESYKLAFNGAEGRELDCGAFRLQLAYVQGDAKDSRLDLTTYRNLTAKLDRIGGLYIYRDDIRVLPYGNPDFDFLGIELRRTRNVGRAFFSYRRMFGVIELDGERNSGLSEKAGREGFRDNRAYRQFRDVLRNFLTQVAATYFQAKGNDASARFAAGRKEAQRRYEQRKKREEEAARKRARFEKRVGELLSALADKRPAEDAEAVVDALAAQLAALSERDAASTDALLEAELDSGRRLDQVRATYTLSPPAGFGLTTSLRSDWDFLRSQLDELEDQVFTDASRKMSQLVNAARKSAKAGPDRQRRLTQFIEHAADDARGRVNGGTKEALAAAASAGRMVETTSSQGLDSLDKAVSEALEAVRAHPPATDAALVKQRLDVEQRLKGISETEAEDLLELAERLRRAVAGSDKASGRGDLTALLEEEVLELRDRAERDFELAQLGMATQVISHELDVTIVEVRAGLRRLRAWADVNPELGDVESGLRTAFDHLDGYLSLFTPLQRRLRRRREQISGADIEKFLLRLFGRRLEQLNIELRTSDAFRGWKTVAFRSALYPVFINIIDNATYWVRQGSPPYWINLDAAPRGLRVSDSGPGIPERDREVVWEYGFSRKPGGRGAGLHISREVLTREGWHIEVESAPHGSAFLISPPKDEEG
jgi:signal transduction histidine kinase